MVQIYHYDFQKTTTGYGVFCVVFYNMMLSCKMLVPCATEQQETNNGARNRHGQWTITSPIWCYCWLLLYSAILRSQADSLRSHVILHEWLAFYSAFLNTHWIGVLMVLIWLVPHETATVSACSVYTIQPCHFMQSHIHKVSACVFSCNLPPALLAEWPGSFTCYCGNTGVEWIPK